MNNLSSTTKLVLLLLFCRANATYVVWGPDTGYTGLLSTVDDDPHFQIIMQYNITEADLLRIQTIIVNHVGDSSQLNVDIGDILTPYNDNDWFKHYVFKNDDNTYDTYDESGLFYNNNATKFQAIWQLQLYSIFALGNAVNARVV